LLKGTTSKSPFVKGGFRGIFRRSPKSPLKRLSDNPVFKERELEFLKRAQGKE
jgi:hypothetical protein